MATFALRVELNTSDEPKSNVKKTIRYFQLDEKQTKRTVEIARELILHPSLLISDKNVQTIHLQERY